MVKIFKIIFYYLGYFIILLCKKEKQKKSLLNFGKMMLKIVFMKKIKSPVLK